MEHKPFILHKNSEGEPDNREKCTLGKSYPRKPTETSVNEGKYNNDRERIKHISNRREQCYGDHGA
jgi:hypothetical protein